MGTGSYPVLIRSGTLHDHLPHIAPRLKEEESYTFTPYLSFRGLLLSELLLIYIYLYLYTYTSKC